MPSWLETVLLTSIFFLGLAALCVGVWWIYPPVGLIAAGGIAAAAAGLAARRSPPPTDRP